LGKKTDVHLVRSEGRKGTLSKGGKKKKKNQNFRKENEGTSSTEKRLGKELLDEKG